MKRGRFTKCVMGHLPFYIIARIIIRQHIQYMNDSDQLLLQFQGVESTAGMSGCTTPSSTSGSGLPL